MHLPPPPDWPHIVHPGNRIFIGSGAAAPVALIRSLLDFARHNNDLEILQGLTIGEMPWTEEIHTAHIRVNAVYLDPRLSDLVNRGIDDYTPAHYSELPGMFRDRVIGIDVALIMVSPPDQFGYCSLGPSVDLIPSAIESANCVVAQINDRMPRTNGLSFVHLSRLSHVLEHSAELPEFPAEQRSSELSRIGIHVAQLINDGDTLQIGLGQAARNLVAALEQHRHLGIHSELMGDGLMELIRKGVVDNSRKSLLPGKSVVATAMGSQELYRFIDGNPHVEFRPCEFVNDPITIARNDRMVSVNSALQVDLTGQVAIDSVRGLFRSGIASQADFMRGASLSKNGRPIIALPSTTTDQEGKTVSRIVAEMSAGAGIGNSRADIHHVVTEYGIATLRGRTIQERVAELIQVAHPDFREDLLRAARDHHLVPSYFQITPPAQSGRELVGTRRIRLKDDRQYLIRPLTPADDRRLQEFFYSHTEETINRRYGFTVTRMSRERAFELVGVDQNHDLALAIIELMGPRQVIHAVGRYYLDRDGRGAEMAFVVSEKKRRVGMARSLLDRMLEVAQDRGLELLWAQVDRDNQAMITLFRKYPCRELPGEDLNSIRIEIPLREGPEENGDNQAGRNAFLNLGRLKNKPKKTP